MRRQVSATVARNRAIRAQDRERRAKLEAAKPARRFFLMTRVDGSVAMFECDDGHLTSKPEHITFRYCAGCNDFLDPDLFDLVNAILGGIIDGRKAMQNLSEGGI